MKTKKIIFSILVLVFAAGVLFAQDDVYYNPDNQQTKEKREKLNKRKINTGYVFIDGKYVESPYRLRIKDGNLFINKTQACTQKIYSDNLKQKDVFRVGYPPCVSRDSDWEERKNCKINGTDISYDYMMKKYFLKQYNIEIAYDSIINYYRHYPNVESFEEFEELNGGVYKIICHNGNELLYQFSRDNFIKKYGKEKSNKSLDVVEMYLDISIHNLKNGYALFFDSDRPVSQKSFMSENDMAYICKTDTIDSLRRAEIIKPYTKNKNIIKHVLEEYKNNVDFFKRIEKKRKSCNETSENVDNKTTKHFSKSFNENNYSSNKNKFVAFFPVDYESSSDMSAEIKSIKLNIENQGFVFSDINYLYDETANDDDLANMPYSQLTELCEEAGFLYVGSHGNINTLLIGRTMHPAAIEFWCNYDEDVYIAATDEEDYPSEWNHDNPLFSAIVNSDWINKYWKVDLENNNTVTILSACKAHSGIGESCAGGICFAYDEDTYLNTCIQNNENLLKKMNGKRNNSQYRSAIDAYDNMILLSGFTYEANASITLCPATKDFYPSNNELVPSTVTEGYFEIDTWCDATIPA
ncbi:MAG: hypothetical protein RBR97_17875, partial [Bacteroidales bacterium]|nr:hypothetical protein [Bacteroidales bacterium]